jgi:hypothetical protein
MPFFPVSLYHSILIQLYPIIIPLFHDNPFRSPYGAKLWREPHAVLRARLESLGIHPIGRLGAAGGPAARQMFLLPGMPVKDGENDLDHDMMSGIDHEYSLILWITGIYIYMCNYIYIIWDLSSIIVIAKNNATMVYSIQFSEDVNWYIGQIYILTS